MGDEFPLNPAKGTIEFVLMQMLYCLAVFACLLGCAKHNNMLPDNAADLLVFLLFLGCEIGTMLLVKQCTFFYFAFLVTLLQLVTFLIGHRDFSMWVGRAMHALLAFFVIQQSIYNGLLTLVGATFAKMCGIIQ